MVSRYSCVETWALPGSSQVVILKTLKTKQKTKNKKKNKQTKTKNKKQNKTKQKTNKKTKNKKKQETKTQRQKANKTVPTDQQGHFGWIKKGSTDMYKHWE